MTQQRLKRRSRSFSLILILASVLVALAGLGWGAVSIHPSEIFSAFAKMIQGSDDLSLNERIFMELRLPRLLLCFLVGAALAVGGGLLQALFRNPIVEPGLIGTSSGAAFGAACCLVIGTFFSVDQDPWVMPLAACFGGMLATGMVVMLSSKNAGKNSVVSLLLIGIAINALFLSGVGFMAFIARDPQARSITFWNLGTLSGANWTAVAAVSIAVFLCMGLVQRYGKQLNALMLGEQEAGYLGVDVGTLKWRVLVINVVMVSVATAFVGVISFVGLIVPHLVRMVMGADNRYLLCQGALLGGLLLAMADLVARLLLAPAELPIGIVTSVVGVPVFIFLLRKNTSIF